METMSEVELRKELGRQSVLHDQFQNTIKEQEKQMQRLQADLEEAL